MIDTIMSVGNGQSGILFQLSKSPEEFRAEGQVYTQLSEESLRYV